MDLSRVRPSNTGHLASHHLNGYILDIFIGQAKTAKIVVKTAGDQSNRQPLTFAE
jgi:hypothetical protein